MRSVLSQAPCAQSTDAGRSFWWKRLLAIPGCLNICGRLATGFQIRCWETPFFAPTDSAPSPILINSSRVPSLTFGLFQERADLGEFNDSQEEECDKKGQDTGPARPAQKNKISYPRLRSGQTDAEDPHRKRRQGRGCQNLEGISRNRAIQASPETSHVARVGHRAASHETGQQSQRYPGRRPVEYNHKDKIQRQVQPNLNRRYIKKSLRFISRKEIEIQNSKARKKRKAKTVVEKDLAHQYRGAKSEVAPLEDQADDIRREHQAEHYSGRNQQQRYLNGVAESAANFFPLLARE